MTSIVVTGGAGVMGRALREALPMGAVFLTREDCDVRNVAGVRHALAQHAPDVVIHAAALTDHQTTDFANLIATNVFGTENVARATKGIGAALIYLSTHYVYPGDGPYYREGSRVLPIGAYAWSKLAGERWVQQFFKSRRFCIVRGSWYTRETRLDKWARRGALTDAWCSREPAAQAARKIAALAEACAAERVAGVVNIGGERRTFAQILRDEGYVGFPQRTRIEIDAAIGAPYIFPMDVSVNTARFDALGLKW